MQIHAKGPGAGWSWLARAVNLGRDNPKAIFGGVALVAVIAMLPSVLQMLVQYVFKLDAATSLSVMGVATLLMVLVYPLLIGGLLRVIDAAERGEPTHATAIFDTFRGGHDGGRLIGFGMLIFAIYIAVFVVVVMLFGKEFFTWYMELINVSMQPDTAAATAAASEALEDMPDGLGTLMGVGTIAGLFFGGVYTIGFGQVALGGRRAFAALGDGVVGTLKNVLPIVVLAIIAFIALMVFALVFGIVVALLAFLGSLIHPAAALLFAMPAYLGMLLLMYVVMFGVMYYMWRDICGDAITPADDRFEA